MNKTLFLAALTWLLTCANSMGGGSLPAEEVFKILQRNDSLWSFLNSTLQFSETAWGVRCGSHWPHMGGARIGPYTLSGTSRSDTSSKFIVAVECEQHFFDEKNKELPLKDGQVTDEIITHAVRVEEKALYIKLIPDEVEKVKEGGATKP